LRRIKLSYKERKYYLTFAYTSSFNSTSKISILNTITTLPPTTTTTIPEKKEKEQLFLLVIILLVFVVILVLLRVVWKA